MRLTHRGMTLDLDDADARVPIIEALLFGRSLPPPFPVESAPPPPLREAPSPAVAIPSAFDAFWAELHDLERHELTLLAAHRFRPDELEKAIGGSHLDLAAIHSRMARIATKNGLGMPVVTRGTKRSSRTYGLAEGLAPVVQALAARVIPGEPAGESHPRARSPAAER